MKKGGQEREYKMCKFFKACVAYSGILVKLALHELQGELVMALFIYSLNLYNLLENYT